MKMPVMPPVNSSSAPLSLDNITDGEVVHQRCILLCGQCSPYEIEDDSLSVSSADIFGTSSFPLQTWPVAEGRFKALIILSPGSNVLTLKRSHHSTAEDSLTLTLTYIPLLQFPPLHLAIMVAKDSPLLIDCPPAKRGGISTAHADLDAAIAKFRMTAYMWQGLTAEDMRSKGLGRRAFRFEEEWNLDTLSRDFLNAAHESSPYNTAMRSTAKVHIIRSGKTVAELRHLQVAQQNPRAGRGDDLHKWFTTALKTHGAPFNSAACPIVAGLILDSHYSPVQDMILGHAALGASNPKGVSLGMIGSHLTYSWPRFLEEVPACLLDTTPPGDTVGNDNGQCGSLWEACSVGQGAFLHEVGHAFGAPHTTGIMARGYAVHWPKNFLSRTAFCTYANEKGFVVIDGETENDARWDLRDALSFKILPHFSLPKDPALNPLVRDAKPTVQVRETDSGELQLVIESLAKIARVQFQDVVEVKPSVALPASEVIFNFAELERRFDRTQPMKLHVLGLNGQERAIGDVWRMLSNKSYVRIPGSSVILNKRSVIGDRLVAQSAAESSNTMWQWAVLLHQKGRDGKLTRATKIDIRVGCALDGAVVYFEDGQTVPCGPRWGCDGRHHHFGGHASKMISLPANVDITKIEVCRSDYSIEGLRIHLANGVAVGELNNNQGTVDVLEPATNEKIIGFYGQSRWQSGFSPVEEFGIITAPHDVELPSQVYDLSELKNTDGGTGEKPGKGQHNDENENGAEDDGDEVMDDGYEEDDDDNC